MNLFLRIGDGARRVTAAFAAVTLAILALLIFVDVIGRYLFSSPLPGTVELIESLMGVVMFGALIMATHGREHIRLDFLLNRLSPKGRTIFEKISEISIVLVMCSITWGLWIRTESLHASGDLTPVLHLPLYLMTALAFMVTIVACFVAIGVLLDSHEKFDSPQEMHDE